MITTKPAVTILWPHLMINKKSLRLKGMLKGADVGDGKHISISLHIKTDRATAHNLARVFETYSEIDSKYCNYRAGEFGVECIFIEPEGMTMAQHRAWFMSCQVANDHYLALLELGADQYTAQSVLPGSVKTMVVITTNLEELLVAVDSPLLKEIAPQIKVAMHFHAPKLFGDSEVLSDE